MKGHHFPNYGYIRCSLPSPLFQSLKKECKTAESNTPLTTGLTATPGSADHYLMSEKNTQKLFEFLIKLSAPPATKLLYVLYAALDTS